MRVALLLLMGETLLWGVGVVGKGCGRGTRGDGGGCECWLGWTSSFCNISLCIHGKPVVPLYTPPCTLKTCPNAKQCNCEEKWTSEFCEIPRCFYGTLERSSGRCKCVGNYEAPHCQSCKSGFYGIDCKFKKDVVETYERDENQTLSDNRRYTGRGNRAIPLALTVGFGVFFCIGVISCYRCATVLVAWLANLYQSVLDNSRTRRSQLSQAQRCAEERVRDEEDPFLDPPPLDPDPPPPYNSPPLLPPPPSYSEAINHKLYSARHQTCKTSCDS